MSATGTLEASRRPIFTWRRMALVVLVTLAACVVVLLIAGPAHAAPVHPTAPTAPPRTARRMSGTTAAAARTR